VLAPRYWARCCGLTHYARKAVELGTTKEELSEMLAVASVMGGCVGETWALKALAAAKPTVTADGPREESCCAHP
jgi:alkylhydroperoxidase/carboxymuconolactone decarboxylase family protein YurZ